MLESYKEAITCYDEAIKLNPTYYQAWFNKGTELCKLGAYEEAISCFDETIKINPDIQQALFNKEIALRHLEKEKKTKIKK